MWLFNFLIVKYQALYNSVGSVLTRVLGQKGTMVHPILKVGDTVLSKTGQHGKVLRVYRSIKTNRIEACTVMWGTPYNDELITLIMPVSELQL